MNWKAILKTVGHAAIGGAIAGVAAYDPSKSVSAMAAVVAASAATSVLSLYSDSPIGKSVMTIVQTVITAKQTKKMGLPDGGQN